VHTCRAAAVQCARAHNQYQDTQATRERPGHDARDWGIAHIIDPCGAHGPRGGGAGGGVSVITPFFAFSKLVVTGCKAGLRGLVTTNSLSDVEVDAAITSSAQLLSTYLVACTREVVVLAVADWAPLV
jgi:hypothetical protein